MVVVTSRGGEDDRQRGLEAGADAYIVKDEFDQQALLETVEPAAHAMTQCRASARVLVCDDSPTYARGADALPRAPDGDLEVVGVCASGEETLAALARLAPDLVTMDLELPGMGGIRAIEEIMRSHAVPILVLSGARQARLRAGGRGARRGRARGAAEDRRAARRAGRARPRWRSATG